MSKGTSMFLVALLAAASLALGCQGKSDEVVEVEAADVEIDEDVERYKVPVGGQPSKGPDDALVTIVEFSEFQCPFCARVLPTVKQIQ
ncbi:MAG: thioredoxin domain-containing protein, partial [Myxococcota bacterium]